MGLAHDVAGSGPALLLLHSAVCDRRMWEPQWPALVAAGYRVVRADLRGFGETPVADRPYSNAEDVVELLRALGYDEVAVVGSSFGGRVALEVAARWPHLVPAMVLLCAGRPGQVPGPALRSFGECEDALLGAGDVAGAVELNVSTFVGPDADGPTRDRVRLIQRHAFDVQLAAVAPQSSTEAAVDLAAVTASCLAVSGGRDLPDFRQVAADLAGLLPHAEHRELPWAGHLPSLERPAEVTDLVTGFLRATVPPVP
ncbi:MAG: alpha/beta fold hydrolase [Streptosporangiales bacterium]|nr:alpha/beta fold hydrolase [Streptosporangiales bacterium]